MAQQLGVGGPRVATALVLLIPLVAIGLRRAWLDRRELSRADIAIVTAAAITAIVLLAPKSLGVVNAGRLVTPPQVDADAVADLREMRGQIPEPASTLVIGEHGLEWWSGYVLHTSLHRLQAGRVLELFEWR